MAKRYPFLHFEASLTRISFAPNARIRKLGKYAFQSAGLRSIVIPKSLKEIGIACLIGALISFIYYIVVSYREFGGVTEDSAGFFVQICEVVIPLAALIAYKRWW